MTDILGILLQYEGSGMILILYVVAMLFLFWKEKNKTNRIVFLYLPLTAAVLFILPPFYKLYAAVEGSDTYYRILWLLPMTITIGYVLVRECVDKLWIGVIVLCAVIAVTGNYTYDNENILRAENRLHIPQSVIDVSDFIMNETQGEQTMVAMPVGFVQFVRQYDSRIWMPYGREMLMPQWSNYYHSVYEAMRTDNLDAAQLSAAVREYNCEYVVLESSKTVNSNLEEVGLYFLSNVDGYEIYEVGDVS